MPIRWVLVRDPDGKRDPQAFFSTDTTLEPADIIALFVRRWQIEVTFAETRAHLGVETQRQWSDKAILRTTPALLGLYSLISLWACDLLTSTTRPYAAAWYQKTSLTFSDAIGAVRLTLWVGGINQHSPPNREPQCIPPTRIIRMAQPSASLRKRTKSSLDSSELRCISANCRCGRLSRQGIPDCRRRLRKIVIDYFLWRLIGENPRKVSAV